MDYKVQMLASDCDVDDIIAVNQLLRVLCRLRIPNNILINIFRHIQKPEPTIVYYQINNEKNK